MNDTKHVDVNAHRITKAYFWGKPLFLTEAQIP